jgi:peptide/nickel transport system substrate-binding protein/oligopeptide transport system substrate-binding protein
VIAVRRRTAVLALVALLAFAAVAGCTSGGGSDAPGGSGGTGGGGANRGRTGGTLAIALLDPGPLDPGRAEGLEDEVVLGNLFDGLTTIDPSGAVRPAVAASWSSDPDLRRWEFRLRPDARWSDGAPLRSTDFTFAWHRLADPTTRPRPPARTLLSGVTGYRAFAAGRADSITGLQTPDPATLVVELGQPFADLPALVAALPLSPLPSAEVGPDPAAYLTRPIGNGPFRLAAPARPGRALTLDRNPAYWGAPALLDKVSVHVAPDEQTAWLELQNGQVAFAPVPPDQLPAARTVHGPSADGRTTPGLLQGPTLTTWHLTFDMKSTPARDPGWRQAVSLAIDRNRLATTLAGSPATGLVPPATPGRGAAAPPCRVCTHDPAKARTLLAKAKKPSTPITLAIPPGVEARRVATLVAGDLTAAGIMLTPTPTPKGETPLTLVRGVTPYPRPDPFLATPSSTSPPAKPLLEQARATPDDPARATLYQQAEAAILTDLSTAPLVAEHHAAVLAPGPQGFDLTPWNTLDLAAISLPA